MTIQIDEATRKQVADFLPGALQKTLDSYYEFMTQDVPMEPKKFSEHHRAGNVAISHMNLLLKMVAWAGVEPEMKQEPTYLAAREVARNNYDIVRGLYTEDEDENDFHGDEAGYDDLS